MMYGKKSPSSKRIKSNPSDEKWIECNLSFSVCVKSVAPESRKKMKKKKKKTKNPPFLFLEQEVATHSSILAWKIPWTEEPG